MFAIDIFENAFSFQVIPPSDQDCPSL